LVVGEGIVDSAVFVDGAGFHIQHLDIDAFFEEFVYFFCGGGAAFGDQAADCEHFLLFVQEFVCVLSGLEDDGG
jgi:hypothetical protein